MIAYVHAYAYKLGIKLNARVAYTQIRRTPFPRKCANDSIRVSHVVSPQSSIPPVEWITHTHRALAPSWVAGSLNTTATIVCIAIHSSEMARRDREWQSHGLLSSVDRRRKENPWKPTPYDSARCAVKLNWTIRCLNMEICWPTNPRLESEIFHHTLMESQWHAIWGRSGGQLSLFQQQRTKHDFTSRRCSQSRKRFCSGSA